jgi:hypothetical protein
MFDIAVGIFEQFQYGSHRRPEIRARCGSPTKHPPIKAWKHDPGLYVSLVTT